MGFSPKDSDKNFVKAILVLLQTLRRLHVCLSAKWKGTVVQTLYQLILGSKKLYSSHNTWEINKPIYELKTGEPILLVYRKWCACKWMVGIMCMFMRMMCMQMERMLRCSWELNHLRNCTKRELRCVEIRTLFQEPRSNFGLKRPNAELPIGGGEQRGNNNRK